MFEATHPEIQFAERNGCGFWQLEDPPIHFCDGCGDGIFEDDDYYDTGDCYCTDCIEHLRKTAKAA